MLTLGGLAQTITFSCRLSFKLTLEVNDIIISMSAAGTTMGCNQCQKHCTKWTPCKSSVLQPQKLAGRQKGCESNLCLFQVRCYPCMAWCMPLAGLAAVKMPPPPLPQPSITLETYTLQLNYASTTCQQEKTDIAQQEQLKQGMVWTVLSLSESSHSTNWSKIIIISNILA